MTPPASTGLRVMLLLCCWLVAGGARAELFGNPFAADEPVELRVADPYIELHTGPGRGYPVFHVEERDATIEVLKRKTDWFKVRTRSGKEGWVARKQLVRTLTPAGERPEVRDASKKEFSFHRWEGGLLGGDFDSSDVLTIYGGFFPTANVSIELSASKIFASSSDADMANISLLMHPFPQWRVSPFVSLGTGVIRTNPKSTLVQESDRTDQIAHAGVGVRVYLARRFIFRAQYRNHVIFQSTNDNEEINEWKAGFAVFF
ncbi:MAG TPA: hypothetical protein ENK05_09915 [Gammaproteobacteria bacterium]|nr:hypothetical protein [Gammaproteobacteria bacterium]